MIAHNTMMFYRMFALQANCSEPPPPNNSSQTFLDLYPGQCILTVSTGVLHWLKWSIPAPDVWLHNIYFFMSPAVPKDQRSAFVNWTPIFPVPEQSARLYLTQLTFHGSKSVRAVRNPVFIAGVL